MQICRRVYSPIVLLITFLSGAILAMPASAQDGSFYVPPGFVLERVIQGLNTPTSFAIAPDGRIYVTQKDGRVRVFHDNDLLGEPFIDLRYEVNDAADRGLMGIALHPRFPTVPHMYLSYVYDPPEIRERNPAGARVSRLLRIDADPADLDTHVRGSGLVLLGKFQRKGFGQIYVNGIVVRDIFFNIQLLGNYVRNL